MIIDFTKIEETANPNFKGGEKEYNVRTHLDGNNRIMKGRLVPGASIGYHKHEGSSEIIFILSGQGKVLYDGGEERVQAGDCHYCPEGHSHSLINDSENELVFYAVVPQHGG